MYMSYCRFEGTKNELSACIGEVYDHINEEAEYPVSEREIKCFKDIVKQFHEFLWEAELLDESGELDEEALESVCKQMAMNYGEE